MRQAEMSATWISNTAARQMYFQRQRKSICHVDVCNAVNLKKVIIAQKVKKFFDFPRTKIFIAAFIRRCKMRLTITEPPSWTTIPRQVCNYQIHVTLLKVQPTKIIHARGIGIKLS
jgi:hypothetical protein